MSGLILFPRLSKNSRVEMLDKSCLESNVTPNVLSVSIIRASETVSFKSPRLNSVPSLSFTFLAMNCLFPVAVCTETLPMMLSSAAPFDGKFGALISTSKAGSPLVKLV
jgi:hypothetical protein